MARKNDIATHRWNSDVFSSGGAQTRSSQAVAAKKLCHSCQFRNDATASTCARCANSLLRACLACGKMMDVGSACWACGYQEQRRGEVCTGRTDRAPPDVRVRMAAGRREAPPLHCSRASTSSASTGFDI